MKLSTPTHPRRLAGVLAALTLGAGLLSACSGATDDGTSRDGEEQAAPPVEVAANVDGPTPVPVDTLVELRASAGTLSEVVVTPEEGGSLRGELGPDGTTWVATERLEPGTTYTLTAVVIDGSGTTSSHRSTFTTEDLTLDQQTFASIAPLDGETVGVGMPVVVHFDLAVKDRATFEQHMEVTSTPAQEGSWHWVSDHEARFRPKDYWKPGTEVLVELDINALPAGDGIYGQDSRRISFKVGDEVISRVDARAHQMQTWVNGELVRTMSITTGKEGFTTRSGTKVIMEKHRTKRMNSETVGIPAGSPDAYDIADVQYALRITSSGEFLHAAPWSSASQGLANVSHGCTGMSLEDAKWFYELSKRGDIVDYTGTGRPMTLHNGYGDWNASFAEYAEGSAL